MACEWDGFKVVSELLLPSFGIKEGDGMDGEVIRDAAPIAPAPAPPPTVDDPDADADADAKGRVKLT